MSASVHRAGDSTGQKRDALPVVQEQLSVAVGARLDADNLPQSDNLSPVDPDMRCLTEAHADQTDLFDDAPNQPKRNPWAWLIKKVFLIDVTDCPDCGGKMKWLEACTEQRDINRVLAAHGLAARARPPVAMVPLGQLHFAF